VRGGTLGARRGWYEPRVRRVEHPQPGRPLGDDETIAPADLAWARAALAPMGEHVRMEGIFGPEVALPDDGDASDQDRFLAWTGRHP